MHAPSWCRYLVLARLWLTTTVGSVCWADAGLSAIEALNRPGEATPALTARARQIVEEITGGCTRLADFSLPPSKAMTTDEMKDIVKQHFEDLVNQKDLEAADRNFATTFIDHDGPGPLQHVTPRGGMPPPT